MITARKAKWLPWWHYRNKPVVLKSGKTYNRYFMDIEANFVGHDVKNVKIKNCIIISTPTDTIEVEKILGEKVKHMGKIGGTIVLDKGEQK